MQQITEAFLNALNSPSPRYIKKIFLSLRKISNGTETFLPETEISDKLIEISPIKWKLDNEGYGIWNMPNAVLTFTDIDGEFREGGPLIPPGVLIYKSKIAIRAGVISGGAVYTAPMFEGYIFGAPVYQPEEKTVTVTVCGRMAGLAEINAEEIALRADDEEAARSENTKFHTLHGAVSCVRVVKKGAAAAIAEPLIENYDYTVENLNSYQTPALIELKQAAAAGDKIFVSYSYWHQDKGIEWLAGAVADLGGITEREIESVNFQYDVVNNFDEGAGNAFSGLCVGAEIVNNIVTLGNAFPPAINAEWTSMEKPSGINWEFSPDGVIVTGGLSSYASARAPQTLAYGTWQFQTSIIYEGQKCYYYFISNSGVRGTTKGYAVNLEKTSGYLYIRIQRLDTGLLKVLATATSNFGMNITECIVRVTRSSSGDFRIYCKALAPVEFEWRDLGVVCNDKYYTESSYQLAVFYGFGAGNNISRIKISDQIPASLNTLSPSGDYLSPVIYGGENINSWGAFSAVEAIPSGCSGSFYLRGKKNSSEELSSWQSFGSNMQVPAQFKYVQLKWTGQASSGGNSPSLISWHLQWFTKNMKLAVINTSGMTGLDVIKELAFLSTFETGFDRNGKFIFRSRKTSASGAARLGAGDIVKVENLNSGLDYVYNDIRARFGGKKISVNPRVLAEARPDSLDVNGRRELSLSSSAFLPPESVDIGTTLATAVYHYLKDRRKRAALTVKFLPQLDLGDIVEINYNEPLKESAAKYLNGIFMIIEGIEFDLENWTARLDLAEVL